VRIQDHDCLPIFSSLPRLQSFVRQESSYLVLPTRQFLEITRGADLALNPGSEYSKIFTAAEIAGMLEGHPGLPHERIEVKQDTQILLGQPSNYPTELVEALKRFFQQKPEVRRAWVARYVNPQQGPNGHTLIAIDTNGDWNQLMPAVGHVIQSVKVPELPVDVMQIRPGDSGGFSDYFLTKTAPFYQA